MSISFRPAPFITICALASCGKPLGTYEVRDVRVVPASAVKTVEPEIDPDPRMLRIEFTSKTDLYNASDGGHEGLYVFASFCPFQDQAPIYVSEPYYNDRTRYDPDTHEDRQPIKDARTGEYVYTTYLRLRGDPGMNRGDGRPNFTGYDLRLQRTDLCLRIEHPGYFIIPSRSHIFKVPAAAIQHAFYPN